MNVAQHLERSARYYPERCALVFKDRSWTYREMADAAGRAAAGLASLGLGAGDRVCLLLPNSPEFLIAYFGLQTIGAVPISLNVMFKAGESAFIANDSGAVAFIVH